MRERDYLFLNNNCYIFSFKNIMILYELFISTKWYREKTEQRFKREDVLFVLQSHIYYEN